MWDLHADPNLAQATLELYAMLWDTHILPRLGQVALRDLTPELIQRFRVELEAAGTGPASVRKALTLLHGILQRACEWGRLTSNPVAAVRKPPARRSRTITPLPPTTVERIRHKLLAAGRLRDATLVSVLAYAGLRPGEVLALKWRHVRERTLLVEGAVSLGELKDTKTGHHRTVKLLAPLAHDIAEWRIARGSPEDDELVFPGHDGTPWTRVVYQNWRRRIYNPTATASGVHSPRPYDLRHSFVSLLIQEGRSVVEVAPPGRPLTDYGAQHLRARLRRRTRRTHTRRRADPPRTSRRRGQGVRRARRCTRFVPARRGDRRLAARNPCNRRWAVPDSNRRPPACKAGALAS
jgi:integrase